MNRGRRWSDLSERNRRLVVVGAVLEGALKIAALIDLKRRPATEIRGRKWIWATVVTLVNSVGVVPLAYLLFGRRRRG
jgi:Phospholipase_D-nuclease N-terminal